MNNFIATNNYHHHIHYLHIIRLAADFEATDGASYDPSESDAVEDDETHHIAPRGFTVADVALWDTADDDKIIISAGDSVAYIPRVCSGLYSYWMPIKHNTIMRTYIFFFMSYVPDYAGSRFDNEPSDECQRRL